MTAAIQTIGYQGLTQGRLIDALRAAGTRRVIDVRAVLSSRRPGFSGRVLAAALAEAAIGYVSLKALGTPKAGRDAAHGGDWETFRRIVDAALAAPEAQAALTQAERLARDEGPVCLLCFEADPASCHRSLIASELARRLDLPVAHLRP